jgi:hypothetical protein
MPRGESSGAGQVINTRHKPLILRTSQFISQLKSSLNDCSSKLSLKASQPYCRPTGQGFVYHGSVEVVIMS